jgi:flagellar motility protein MotE (MotC chaperone)
MKRIIIASQIIIIALVFFKILFLTESLQELSFLSAFHHNFFGQAIAQTAAKAPVRAVRDVVDNGLREERDLLALLQKKQKELDTREVTIKAEEEKIRAVKKEIIEKIDMLKALDAQLSAKLDVEQSGDAKRLKDLAKVYEATPPQKAAAMLEKLDTATAAGISISMKRDRAGLIWGFLSPQKAIEITREITKKSKIPSE